MNSKFHDNPLGAICDVCDRIWFQNDLKTAPASCVPLLATEFIDEDVEHFKLCANCYRTLTDRSKPKIPTLSRSNGFVYVEFPKHLPPLNCISERLVSPRIPFMQIRHLKRVGGSKAIVGQIINVPVDVNTMVQQLPRELDDDHAFNVHIKKHLLHSSVAYKGLVKKSTVKAWLTYLLQTTLYKAYCVTLNKDFLQDESTDNNNTHTDDDDETDDTVMDVLEPNPEYENEVLAKQKMLMWSEEQYLTLAPGMNQTPTNIIFDEHAEELSFPAIYLGHPRTFKRSVHVTPFLMATSEIQRSDTKRNQNKQL